MSEAEPKPSAVEGIKTESNFLRGRIAEELVDGNPNLGKDTIQLIKFHGSYEQDDRDRRAEAKANKVPGGKYYSYMIRIAMPGGLISSPQLLAQLDLCDEVGNSTLRVTTRQGIQLHGVLKGNLKKVIRRINEVQLTTIAACGDVRRNVMCSPAPYKNNPVYDQLQAMADEIADETMPRTSAYHELWLTDDAGEKTLAGGGEPEPARPPEEEPLYGPTYLPRKFKMGVALPGDNSADVYSQDIGLLGVVEQTDEGEKVVGYNFVVGGGFGVTPSAAKTFARVATPLGYVPADKVIDTVKAIMKVQRDFGNRSDRKRARMKYLIHDWGMEKFKLKVEEYLGDGVEDSRPMSVTGHNDGMGWHEQGDGLWFYGLNIENGRIKDEGDFRLKSALREVCVTLAPPMRMTPHQGVIFCDIKPEDKDSLTSILKSHGVPLSEETTIVRRWSMACPALPLCGLAVTESERVLPGMMDELEKELDSLGLGDERFTTRMTGCPNGCARPYNSDIGLVGKTKGKYTLFLGGRVEGDRLNWVYKDLVPEEEVVATLSPVLKQYQQGRNAGESFGDYCDRVGKDALLAACDA